MYRGLYPSGYCNPMPGLGGAWEWGCNSNGFYATSHLADDCSDTGISSAANNQLWADYYDFSCVDTDMLTVNLYTAAGCSGSPTEVSDLEKRVDELVDDLVRTYGGVTYTLYHYHYRLVFMDPGRTHVFSTEGELD